MSRLDLPPPSKFHALRVARRVNQFLRARWDSVILLAVFLAWLPQGVRAVVQEPLLDFGGPAAGLVAVVVVLAATLFLQATVVALAAAPRFEPRPTRAGLAMAIRAVPKLLPLWALVIAPVAVPLWLLPRWQDVMQRLSGALSALHFGVALAIAFAVGVYPAVAVAERLGVWNSVRRSYALMKPARWQMVAVYCLTQVAILAGDVAISVAERTVFGSEDTAIGGIAAGALSLTLEAAVAVWWAAFIGQSYRELVRLRDGLPGDEASDAPA